LVIWTDRLDLDRPGHRGHNQQGPAESLTPPDLAVLCRHWLSGPSMRRRLLIVLFGLGALAAAWFAVRALENRHLESELRLARGEFGARRFGVAGARLARLAQRWPDHGEVQYLLGACEKILGHRDAAMEAWQRVPADANQAPLADLSRARLALELGRYRLAQSCLDRAVLAKGEVADEAGRLLEWLYWMTGRRDDNRDVLRRRAEQEAEPSLTLRKLWGADRDPYPFNGMTDVLGKANKSAPDDDLVWLALADLATRTGKFDEAGLWLTKCEYARPQDPAVWKARLQWARAAGRPDELLRAATNLPADAISRSKLLSLRAWLAGRNDDHQAEQADLEAVLTLQPADDAALERLADLAALAGESDRVSRLRRRKAAADEALEHYRELINLPEMTPHAADFARSAEAIGRRFDAQQWWRLAVSQDPSLASESATALARLAKTDAAPGTDQRTLAEVLGSKGPSQMQSGSEVQGPDIPTFVDEANRRGLVFTFDNGVTEFRQLPETMSGGVALLDIDGDGWLDVYAVQGGPFPPSKIDPPFGDRLFRNRGDGRFEDVTAASGLARLKGGYGHGVAVGDYDNDGRPDVFITRFGSYALYHNVGEGRFEDATAIAGLGGDRDWPTSAAWADLDNDGDLDLYVCHYLRWDTEHPTLCEYPEHSKPGYVYCGPQAFPALPDHVFRNDGGRFVDVTGAAGIVDRDGRGLGVVAADLDGDGRTDLFVANDTSANYFFHNRGGFRFAEEGLESGLASGATGSYLAGMGVACGDLDGDGRLDLAVTNFFNQSTTLYHNHGGGLFTDRSAEMGLAAVTFPVLGFGLAALDANNDGWLDLAQANGHVTDFRPSIPYEMRSQLILSDRARRFVDVSGKAGQPWQILRLARGLAVGDVDNDGRTDVLLVSHNAPLALLRNQSTSSHHFLTLALEGTTSNRDGVGAQAAVTASGRTQIAARFGGGSYLSASDHRLHFGLGSAVTVEKIEVTWPSGRRDSYAGLAADTGYRLREGDPTPRPLPGSSGPVTK
jgi:tetratricopeptide (TPR) repeat protein